MDYLELTVKLNPVVPFAEILIAQLAEAGFESFVEIENGIKAYGPVNETSLDRAYENTFLSDKREDVFFELESQIIEEQNWNAQWESDFEPVYIEDYTSILAPFHDQAIAKGIKVIIQPKMSFGTGHHQTTWMMSKSLFDLDKKPYKVLDMGTGTGVLAILSKKLGANIVHAVDIEKWAVENTIENCERNGCSDIQVKLGDIDVVDDSNYDLILANINKNVLKEHIPYYSKLLVEGGTLILSGFFVSDVKELSEFAKIFDFKVAKAYKKEGWAAINLTHVN